MSLYKIAKPHKVTLDNMDPEAAARIRRVWGSASPEYDDIKTPYGLSWAKEQRQVRKVPPTSRTMQAIRAFASTPTVEEWTDNQAMRMHRWNELLNYGIEGSKIRQANADRAQSLGASKFGNKSPEQVNPVAPSSTSNSKQPNWVNPGESREQALRCIRKQNRGNRRW